MWHTLSTEGQLTLGTDGKFWFSLRGQAQPSPQDQSWGHQQATIALTQLPAPVQEGKVLVSGNPSKRNCTWGTGPMLTGGVCVPSVPSLCRACSHTPSTRYLVIDCHLGVGIAFVQSFHLTQQVGVGQIHHPELHRAGMGQGSKLQLSGGSTDSTTSNSCSHKTTATLRHLHTWSDVVFPFPKPELLLLKLPPPTAPSCKQQREEGNC